MSYENKEQYLQKIENLIPRNPIIEQLNEQSEFVKKMSNIAAINGFNDITCTGVPTINFSNNFTNALDGFTKNLGAFVVPEISPAIQSLTNSLISQIAENQRKLISQVFDSFNLLNNTIFKPLIDSLNEARNNPDSILSWIRYYDRLSEFFWILPYDMTTQELYDVLNTITTEKEFDKYISRYFNTAKVKLLIKNIGEMLKNDSERKMVKQINLAYENKSYALANVGLTTMIDNLLSYYLINKGKNSRVGIFEPIIDDLDEKYAWSDFLMVLMIISSNINVLYENVEFNEKISISTNKKSRRHPMAHGKAYSNKKIDTIMLINTLYYLLLARSKLKMYKDSLYHENGKFYIANKEKKKHLKCQIKKHNIKK